MFRRSLGERLPALGRKDAPRHLNALREPARSMVRLTKSAARPVRLAPRLNVALPSTKTLTSLTSSVTTNCEVSRDEFVFNLSFSQ